MKETKIKLSTTYGEMKGDHDCKNCENCTCGKNKINFPERLPEIGHEKFYEFMGWNKIDSRITEVDKLLSLIEEKNLENSPIYVLVRDYFYTNTKEEIKRIIKNRFANKIANLINNNCKKVMVLYHNLDIDGHFVKIISQLFKELDLVDFEFEFLSCIKSADERFNDIKEKINDIDLCLIGDLSFSEEISKEINKLDTDKIVLLDHHAQAIYLNEYDWAMVYPHDIYNFNISSGSLLIYHFISEFSNKNSFQIYIEALANCVAAYDTWFLNDLKTKRFGELYFGHLGNDLNILFKHINKNDFDLLMTSMFANNIIYPDKEKFYDPILFINRNYISNEYEQIIKIENRNIKKSCMMAYNSMSICEIFQGCKFAVVYISDGYASQIGSFILEKQPEIDFVVIVMMGIFTVSFRSRTDEVNVGMLAKLNEGGGHQAASGMTLYNKNIRMLYDQSPKNIIVDIMSKVLDERELIQRLKIKHIKSFEYDKEKNKFIIE